MTISLTIGGVDYLPVLGASTIKLTQQLNGRYALALEIRDGTDDGDFRPALGAEVIIEIDGVRRLGGFVQEFTEDMRDTQGSGGQCYFYAITCADYNQILERRTVNAVFEATESIVTYGDIVEAIHAAVLDDEGITLGSIAHTIAVTGKWTFTHENTVAEDFRRIADATGMELYVDCNKALQFGAFAGVTEEAWQITDDPPSGNWRRLSITRSAKALTTKQRVLTTDFDAYERAETFTGFANASGIIYLPTSLPISGLPRVTVDGNPEVVVANVPSIPPGTDWFWTGTGLQTPDVRNLYGSTVVVSYPTDAGNCVITESADDVSAAAAAFGGSGIFERTYASGEVDTTGAQAIADSELSSNAGFQERVSVEVLGPWPVAGRSLVFNTTRPLISGTYLIDTVESTEEQLEQFRHRVSCVRATKVDGSVRTQLASTWTNGQGVAGAVPLTIAAPSKRTDWRSPQMKFMQTAQNLKRYGTMAKQGIALDFAMPTKAGDGSWIEPDMSADDLGDPIQVPRGEWVPVELTATGLEGPAGDDAKFDIVDQDGNSVLDSPFTVPDGTTAGTIVEFDGTFARNLVGGENGDILRGKVLQVGSSTPGRGFKLMFGWTKKR